ncbi:hypothetical protein BTI_70 [Burkholderia thailandensis MSMB121]|uniref:DUF1700 domain-containing protein n=3 Tax=Burkholderia humptydooensis TaxID=430531 RepID=A0A7U4P104_9BURK|nr:MULTISPECIES: DUF1700 domain-containing protein [Burkholderia]AGK47703.1 hypothetical protein BTI_70 [Burkholderia thailandensis MSMB121]ATF35321.1 DUF1700 domain-containing protein [Burkholderia thailandensis]AJY43604.1 hypothetical protein BW21_142 [Burkholderia sp. 2002721687]ALX40985.1 hypothetical protein AQ610_00125 [Burkholderia humptydooensis]EIP89418.1 hypothetical protein A33K_12997 [Burkholderia humptydooensis MSMB43]
MKQDAFIQRLRQALGSLPKRDIDEIVADYREYIGDALAAGRAEEDVIAALGDPEKLARELKAQANFRQWEERRSFGNLMRVVGSIAGLGLLHLILLVPFLLYMLVLTTGYVFFGALTVAGLVTLVAFGSHYVFGTPVPGVLPFGGGAAQVGAAGAAGATAGKGAADGTEARGGEIANTGASAPGVNVPGVAGGNVQITPDGRGGMNLSVTNGENAVSIVGGRITVDNGKQHVSVAAPTGFALGGIAFGYGLAMLPIGIVGLLVCIWLTRVTWRALVRYVRRRIDAVSAKLERGRVG